MILIKSTAYLALLIISVEMLGWKGKVHSPCSGNSNKLLSILNILCNNTQNTSIQQRDACYGCFFRAGNLPPGNVQLVSLSQCATIYLNNTGYQTCAVQLQNVVNGFRPTPVASTNLCYTGYCEFVRCVRMINANALIDSCIMANLINRDLSNPVSRIGFYTNTTSCILARARCNAYNPITGELQQQQRFTSQTYLFNSLQVSPNGDLRIVSFPGTTGVAELFCSTRSTLEQATYGDAVC
ncbi:hypothetical protein Bhyg_09378 [Pseudolycoriella hygida]|uniref:Uncharacterized protein n=1 Tax=Pseudolycoriella hygida TaxID=35572 RepID=A0A9Q0N870_9DIPT|nr:hypothetical protein Bhyg_09378 [Pseudolycoriella hygida]